MPANMNATSVAHPAITQAEFEFTAAALADFVAELQAELNANPNANTFHLQVHRCGIGDRAGGTAPIDQGDPVRITVHSH